MNLPTGTLTQVLDDVSRERFDVIVWVREQSSPLEQQAGAQIERAIVEHYSLAFADQQHSIVIYQRPPSVA